MRVLFTICSIALILLTAYWYGVKILTSNAPRLLESLDTPDGASLSVESTEIVGFPGSFFISIKDPKIINQQEHFAWTTHEISLRTKSYYPFKWELSASNAHEFSIGTNKIDVNFKEIEAEAYFTPNTKLTLKNLLFFFDDSLISSSDGYTIEAEKAQINVNQVSEKIYILNGSALETIMLGLPIIKTLHGNDKPLYLTSAFIEAEVELDKPLDTSAISTKLPGIEKINIIAAKLKWQETVFNLNATIEVDHSGHLNGTATLRIINWKPIIKSAQGSKIVNQETALFLSSTLEQLSKLSEGQDSITLPLSVSKGKVRYGMLEIFEIY